MEDCLVARLRSASFNLLRAILFNMKKNRKSNRNVKQSKRELVNAPPRALSKVPEVRLPAHRFRRAVSRQISWNPAVGLEGLASGDMQFTYSPGTTDYRIGGTSIYADALPNLSEFTSLYDQYKVIDIVHRIDYTTNVRSDSGVAFVAPLVFFVADYDDPGNAANVDLRQYPQVQLHSFMENGYKPLIFKLKPRPLRTIAGAGAFSGYSPAEDTPYIRTTDTSIPHYGIKLSFIANGGSSNSIVGYFQHTIWYNIEFLNPK